jgi:diguanylate cyclase (GGDEF)-like protein
MVTLFFRHDGRCTTETISQEVVPDGSSCDFPETSGVSKAPHRLEVAVRLSGWLFLLACGKGNVISRDPMKTLREVLSRTPIWVNPDHTVETAIILMKGHDIGALAVMNGSDLAGMVYYHQLLGAPPNMRIRDVMEKDVFPLSPNMTIQEAAVAMSHQKVGRLPVLEDDKLIGIISQGDLLPELGRSYDPLTKLPWADSMRDWAIDHLKRGMEVTVLFLDLDHFGQFNKRYGHIVGDNVLTAVSETLTKLIDPHTDFLCRYGGDEFCITTLRPAEEASEFAVRIRHRVQEIQIDSLDEIITCAIGQFGGKRTREREHTHFAATLNSLINLASRDCMAQKAGTEVEAEEVHAVVMAAPVRSTPRFRLACIDLIWKGYTAQVHVELEIGMEKEAREGVPSETVVRYSANATAETDEEGSLRLVAETTATALRSFLPAGNDILINDVLFTRTGSDKSVITVVGQFITEKGHISIAGSAVVTEARHRAAASAVLAAANRSLGALLSGVH